MKSGMSYMPLAAIEATVSSKGQVTLPKALRAHLGIQTGSRIRFSLGAHGFQVEPILYELEELWAQADKGPRPTKVMSFEDMDTAKARRVW